MDILWVISRPQSDTKHTSEMVVSMRERVRAKERFAPVLLQLLLIFQCWKKQSFKTTFFHVFSLIPSSYLGGKSSSSEYNIPVKMIFEGKSFCQLFLLQNPFGKSGPEIIISFIFSRDLNLMLCIWNEKPVRQ